MYVLAVMYMTPKQEILKTVSLPAQLGKMYLKTGSALFAVLEKTFLKKNKSSKEAIAKCYSLFNFVLCYAQFSTPYFYRESLSHLLSSFENAPIAEDKT